jgi:hypothetical protein
LPLFWGRYCAQAYGKLVRLAVQALLAGPSSWVSKEDLKWYEKEAKHRAFMKDSQAKLNKLLMKNRREGLAAQQGPAAPSSQPQIKAAAPRPAPIEWPPVRGHAVPAATAITRQAAAEASAAAAAAWAGTAAGREAMAETAVERAASQPAGQHTAGAEELEWAAAAWHAAHQALEAARQACPDAPAIREAVAAVQAARALKAQRRSLRGS